MLTVRTSMGRDLPTISLSSFILTTMAFPATKSTQVLVPWTQNSSTFTLYVCEGFSCPLILYPGKYWVEIQANMTAKCCGEWGWTDRTATNLNAAVWRNPSGFFGACQSWGRRGVTCGLDASAPDQVYRIYAQVIVVCSVDSTNLGCGGTINFQPTEFSIDMGSCPVDPATVHTSSFTVNNIQPDSFILLNNNTTITFHYNTTPVVPGLNTMHVPAGGFNCVCGPVLEFTCTFTYEPSTPTPTPTPTVTPCQITITQITGTIVPGTVDIHCDDCVITIPLPFSFTLYDQTFTSVNLSSNGNAQFVTNSTAYINECLPSPTINSYAIFPYWDDLYTVNPGYGIFTSISGTTPNRIFNIEWRAQYFPGTGSANFELRLYEGQTGFDVIYGTVTNGNLSATAGVQRDNTCFTQTSATAQVVRLLAGRPVEQVRLPRRPHQRLLRQRRLHLLLLQLLHRRQHIRLPSPPHPHRLQRRLQQLHLP